MEKEINMDILNEAAVEYRRTGELATRNQHALMSIVRGGIDFDLFRPLLTKYPFSIEDWSRYLHLSERTLQRYRKEKKTFDPLQTEKILQITMLYERGVQVFGHQQNFDTWLNTTSLALGSVKPKDLLDTAFGIDMIADELLRIEHGVLA